MRADLVGVPVARPLRRPQPLGAATTGANTWPTAVNVTPDATAHTKGAWVEITAATTFDVERIHMMWAATSAAGTNSSALLDIGVGAAGSEVVVVPDLAVGWNALAVGISDRTRYDLPLWIPKGSRVAVRAQSARATCPAFGVQMLFHASNSPVTQTRPASTVLAFGADAAASKGVNIVPGAAAAKGAWAEITAATTSPLSAVALGVQGAANTGMQGGTVALDIGVGAAGSETVLVADVYVATSNSELVARGGPLFTWATDIPAGTRIAVRCSNSAGNSSACYVDAIVYGIRRTA